MHIYLPTHDYELCRNPGRTRNRYLAQSSQAIGFEKTGQLVVRSGFCSERGGRAANEDFAAIADKNSPRFGVVAAIADGVGGDAGAPREHAKVHRLEVRERGKRTGDEHRRFPRFDEVAVAQREDLEIAP